jgi:hypothetical protein
VPRANTASTSGHGCAELIAIEALNNPPPTTSDAMRIWPIRRTHMVHTIAAQYPQI